MVILWHNDRKVLLKLDCSSEVKSWQCASSLHLSCIKNRRFLFLQLILAMPADFIPLIKVFLCGDLNILLCLFPLCETLSHLYRRQPVPIYFSNNEFRKTDQQVIWIVIKRKKTSRSELSYLAAIILHLVVTDCK